MKTEDLDLLLEELRDALPGMSQDWSAFIDADVDDGLILLAISSAVQVAIDEQVHLPGNLAKRVELVAKANASDSDGRFLGLRVQELLALAA